MSVLVAAKFPSTTAVLVSCLLSALFLLFIRLVFLAATRVQSVAHFFADSQELVEKSRLASPLSFLTPSWYRNWQWDALPHFSPFSVTKSPFENGSTMDITLFPKAMPVNWQLRRPRPNFQPPLAALYENPVPLSMAKIIMSRHTYRRPNSSRPRRTVPSANRPPAQPTSRLYHSIA